MIFILNLSVEPFFGAFFQKGKLIISKDIPNTKASGEVLFSFLQEHEAYLNKLQWVGAVSGPGGFATLRVAASVCNTIAYKFEVPIRQVRADSWVRSWALECGYEGFVLNSFGKNVFLGTEAGLEAISLEEISGENIWIEALPEDKKSILNINIDRKSIPIESLYQSLQDQEEQKDFVPEYMYEAV